MMPTLPVSVIIPAFNASRWLGRCLETIARSTQAPAEILVIDDGSTDDTRQIALQGGATLLTQSNAGPSAARNRGLETAASEWVAFLDADDEWHPRKLELQFRLLAAEPTIDFLFTDWDELDDESRVITFDAQNTYWNYHKIPKRQITEHGYACDRDSFADLMPQWPFLAASSIVVRRSRALAVGGFPEHMRFAEDLDFFLRYLRLGQPGVVELPLVGYRRHALQATTQELKVRASFVEFANRTANSPGHYHPRSVATLDRLRPTYLAELAAAQIVKDPRKALATFIRAFRASPSIVAAALTFARSVARRFRPRMPLAPRSKSEPRSNRAAGIFDVPWRRPEG